MDSLIPAVRILMRIPIENSFYLSVRPNHVEYLVHVEQIPVAVTQGVMDKEHGGSGITAFQEFCEPLPLRLAEQTGGLGRIEKRIEQDEPHDSIFDHEHKLVLNGLPHAGKLFKC